MMLRISMILLATIASTMAMAPPVPYSPQECIDKSEHCDYWKTKGYCFRGDYVEYMTTNCRTACGVYNCKCFSREHSHLSGCDTTVTPTFAIGRPFKVDGAIRATRSEVFNCGISDDQASWNMPLSVSMIENSTYNHDVGLKWLQQAEGEHASIASFARHTLQLMSIGAPSELLEASQAASIDEIKHAKMCYGLASTFMKKDVIPGVLDVDNSLGELELKDIIRSIIQEGCIEETVAAIEAHYRESLAQDPSVKLALKEIADDETRHAKLAWDTISWISKKHPEYITFIEGTFNDQFNNEKQVLHHLASSETSICPDYGQDEYLQRFGVLVPSDQEKVRRFGVEMIIKPTFEAGMGQFNSIFDKIIGLNVDFI